MTWLLSPLSWLVLSLATLLLVTFWRPRWRCLKGACIVMAAVSAVAMTPATADILLAMLEVPATQADGCAASSPAVGVVLGGGVDATPSGPADFSVLGNATKRRVERAVDWWQSEPDRVLVFSGGPPAPGLVAEARLMMAYAAHLGVAPSGMRHEDESTDTWENAGNLSRLAPRLPTRVALVTSALHAPRARYSMERAGFEVCIIATDFRRVPPRLPGYLVPQNRALGKTELALHEIVGLAYYRAASHWRDQ